MCFWPSVCLLEGIVYSDHPPGFFDWALFFFFFNIVLHELLVYFGD